MKRHPIGSFVPHLGLAPCYQPPLWPCSTQIRVFATHKSFPVHRCISRRQASATSTPPRGVQEDVNELERRFTLVPDRWRAYGQFARVDQPIGTVLSYLPCSSSSFFPISSDNILAWTVSMATPTNISLRLPNSHCSATARSLWGAGCTINDF